MTSIETPVAELVGVGKTYAGPNGGVQALRGITLSLYPGSFVALMGPSGSGKSTLLTLLGLTDTPTFGTYRFMGEDTAHYSEARRRALRAREIGFIFQRFNLVPGLTARENVLLTQSLSGKKGESPEELLKTLGLITEDDTSRLNHLPEQLSGGEQQRVAIARALSHQPRIIIADEPTGSLDSEHARVVCELLRREVHKRNIALIMATHSRDAARFADGIITIRDGVLTHETAVRGI
jgi:ABC-type lipoprotein export system ATPase subunit